MPRTDSRFGWLGPIVIFGAIACSSDLPGTGGQDGSIPDGPTGPIGAGQCIAGALGAGRGGSFPWGDIVVCESQGLIEIRLPRPVEYPTGEVRLWHEVTEDSVARPETDFEGGGGRVAWANGETQDKVFTVRIADDEEVEGDEVLELQLSRAAEDDYWNSYGEHMRILIVDDDVNNASQPFLVANINRGKTEDSHVGEKVAFAGSLYFAADDGRSGLELWRSDGSSSGTTRVRDLLVGLEGSGPSGFAVAGDLLYFTAITEAHGAAVLCRTDGTSEGTVRVLASGEPVSAQELVAYAGGVYFVNDDALWRAVNGGPAERLAEFQAPPQHLVVSGDIAYFAANDGTSGLELWRSDGTASGTQLAADVIPGAEGSFPANLIVLNGKVLFDALEGPGLSTRQFYVSDGTAAGTTGLGTFNYASSLTLTNAVLAGDRVFFTHFPVSYRGSLWVTDGTAQGTARLVELQGISGLTAMGRDAYFSGDDDVSGYEPWRSDGTPEGTNMLANLNTADAQNTSLRSSDPREFLAIGSSVYFTASTAASDRSFWRTDGTSAGTTRLSLGPISPASDLAALGPNISFSAIHETAGKELWVLDVELERAELVRDINLVDRGAAIDELEVFGGRVLFVADDEVQGRELWTSDGTESGTRLLQDLGPEGRPSAPSELTVAGARVFFIAQAADGNRGLWWTDGSASGAQPVPLTSAPLPRLGQLTAFGEQVVFNMNDENEERALWRSDGTPAGTERIGPEVSHLAVVGSTIFVSADGAEGRELWKSDGTSQGLQLVKDVRPGSSGSYPDRFVVAGDHLFFVADDGTIDEGLWRSDGTEAGTVFLAELDRDSSILASGSALYFSAQGGLWRADGTTQTPRLIHERVHDFAAGAGGLYFTVETEDYFLELWTSDGSPNGTRVIRTSSSGWLRDGFEQYIFASGHFLFSTGDGFLGQELWRSDGTRDGTFRVSDLNPGGGDFSPKDFVTLGDAVYFKAYTPETGEELWGYRP